MDDWDTNGTEGKIHDAGRDKCYVAGRDRVI
jgi:hypothetical protein